MASDPASQPLWLIVLSTSAVSAIISAVVSGFYNLRARRDDYVNDYYRTVIKRRIAAYEQLEKLITQLKIAVVDKDNRPYHLMFAVDEHSQPDPHTNLIGVMALGLWLSNEVFAKTRELSILLFSLKAGNELEFGKTNHEKISTLRAELERLMARDMLNLHDVEGFLKSKDQPDPGFSPIRLEH
jgi:hypothetical protein